MDKIYNVQYYESSWRDCVGSKKNKYASAEVSIINTSIREFETATNNAEYVTKNLKKYKSCEGQVAYLLYRG